MPAYDVHFETESGPVAASFTVDQERPLGEQIHLILEELRQGGTYLRGGADHELAILWDGEDIDPCLAPAALGVTPDRPLRLELRRRQARVRVHRPEPRPTPFLPRGSVVFPAAGFVAGVFAWFGTILFAELVRSASEGTSQDLLAGVVFGASVGAVLIGLDAFWRDEPPAPLALLGALLGALGCGIAAVLSGWLSIGVAPEFLRSVAWLVLGLGLGVSVGLRWVTIDPRRVLDAAVFGAAAGGVAGLTTTLPGPSDLWFAMAYGLTGLGVGVGAFTLAFRRAPAVLQLVGLSHRRPALHQTREWILGRDLIAPVIARYPGQTSRPSGRLTWASGLVTYAPTRGRDSASFGGPAQLHGEPMTEATSVLNRDVIYAGVAQYQLSKRYIVDSRSRRRA